VEVVVIAMLPSVPCLLQEKSERSSLEPLGIDPSWKRTATLHLYFSETTLDGHGAGAESQVEAPPTLWKKGLNHWSVLVG
jgi:hypothetical protein